MPDIPFKNYVAFALGANFLTILLVLTCQRFLPPQVPLFYGLPQSEAQLTSSWALAIPSLLSIAVIIANVSLSFLTKNDFLKKILILSSASTAIFAIITVVKIILLVGSF